MRISPAVTLVASIAIGGIAILAARGWLTPSKADATALAQEEIPPAPAPVTVPVVMTKRNIPRGAVVEETRLEVVDWPAEDVPDGSFRSIASIGSTEFTVRRALTPIEAGKPVLDELLSGVGERPTLAARIPPGYRAFSVRMNDVTGVGGFVLPGDHIDILFTLDQSSGSRTKNLSSEVLLQNIEVLGVDLNDDTGTETPDVFKTATVAVSVEDAQKLSLAAESGVLSFVLRGVEDTSIGEYEIARRTVRTATGGLSPPVGAGAPTQNSPDGVQVSVVSGNNSVQFTVPGQ